MGDHLCDVTWHPPSLCDAIAVMPTNQMLFLNREFDN